MKTAGSSLKSIVICVMLFAVIFCWGSSGFCGKVQHFSADQVSLDKDGNMVGTGKIYMTSKKMRMEMKPGEEQKQLINIFRRDKNMHWILNPELKKYMEMTFNEEELKKAANMQIDENAKVLGTERVSGYKCTKKKIETSVKFLGITQKSEMTVWKSASFDMPLRTMTESGEVTELRNINTGRPASRLFEIPSGYEKVDNMAALFGEERGSAFELPASLKNLPKNISDKMPKNLKWPFGGGKETTTTK